MGLSIKRAETERKARLVAERMGVGVTEAIDRALDRALDELPSIDTPEERERRRKAFFAYLRTLPHANDMTREEIEAEMYGEGGEPI